MKGRNSGHGGLTVGWKELERGDQQRSRQGSEQSSEGKRDLALQAERQIDAKGHVGSSL